MQHETRDHKSVFENFQQKFLRCKRNILGFRFYPLHLKLNKNSSAIYQVSHNWICRHLPKPLSFWWLVSKCSNRVSSAIQPFLPSVLNVTHIGQRTLQLLYEWYSKQCADSSWTLKFPSPQFGQRKIRVCSGWSKISFIFFGGGIINIGWYAWWLRLTRFLRWHSSQRS